MATRKAIRSSAPEDHRVRVARLKRERTRAQLLHAVMTAYSGRSRAGPAVIDDVVRIANVARGTFYKYFPSLEDAVSALGAQLADEMVAAIASLYDVLEDPIQRSATGFQLYLCRAKIEPKWGEFLTHLSHLRPENRLVIQIEGDLRRGIKAGAYDVRSIDVGVRLIIGATIEGIRGIVEGAGSRSYIETLTGMMLRALGVPPRAADAVTQATSKRLHAEGPRLFPWWASFN